MQIAFHGAAQTVTGSKHLITLPDNINILLDCGMYQGMGVDTHSLNRHFGFNLNELQYIILSHAHIDHSGLIPRIIKEGFRGKIYCTEATYDLCKIMLMDSAFIQEADVRFVNKRKTKQGKELIKPLYTQKDAEFSLNFFFPLPYNKPQKIGKNAEFIFTNNGHILGSAAVTITANDAGSKKVITYTSDIGRYDSTLMKDPESFPQSDIIICESTYGNRLHDDQLHAEQILLDTVINTCIKKKGKLIIPSFSLGRTQEIVFTLNKLQLHGLLPKIATYVDSPLSVDATEVMRTHINLLNDNVQDFIETRPDPFGFSGLTYIIDKTHSQALNKSNKPCIIISASGMAEAGRVKHHIMHSIADKKNTILIVGYAEPHSLAGKLRNGENEVNIFGDPFSVKAEIIVIDSYSAHADYIEMERYLNCQNKNEVNSIFLVHGNPDVQEEFKNFLSKKGFKNIHIPSLHDTYTI